jgi:hypothetical protein
MRKALVGLALVLSGCGVGGGARQPSVDTLASTVTAQTARKNSAHVAFELDKGTTGEGVYRTSPRFAADFIVTMQGGPTHLIVLDKEIYLQQQAKPWVRSTGSADLAESMTAQADIGRQLARMQAAGTITATVSEYVDGRRTTRYSIDVDIAKLAEVERDSVVQAGLRDLRRQGVARIPYQLWLDEENLPVKVVVTVPGQISTVRYTKWGEPIDVKAPPS